MLVVYVKIDFCNMSHSELVVIIALMYLQGNAFFFLEFYDHFDEIIISASDSPTGKTYSTTTNFNYLLAGGRSNR